MKSRRRLVLQNIDTCLAGAGVSRRHLVSVRVYVTDINKWPTFNKIYGEWIGDFRPSRAVAGVANFIMVSHWKLKLLPWPTNAGGFNDIQVNNND